MSTKQVEPNSGLGKAYNYILKRWDKLTLFLRRPGAPLDNNICERALKMAIAHRRNSLFYKTQHGAAVGDLFMSLIYTAELHHENPFAYLTELQRHAKAVAADPDQWLPWTYRATLARLAAQQPAARAPPPRPNLPPSPAQPAPASSALTPRARAVASSHGSDPLGTLHYATPVEGLSAPGVPDPVHV